jgi:hypothetical protein
MWLPLRPQQSKPIGIPSIVNIVLSIEKVLKKLNFQVSKNDIDHIITNTPDTIERVLKVAQNKIKNFV